MNNRIAAALGFAGVIFATAAHAETVSVFDPVPTTDDVWFLSDMQGGGTAGIVDLSGVGGALENDQPLPNGAARLTTGASNDDKAEVGITRTGGLGRLGEFLLFGGVLNYSYYKDSTGDLNPFAAASIKITIFDENRDPGHGADGFTSFVYEPTWNLGPVGTSVAVASDQWITANITGNSGVFWHTGIYDQDNLAGDGSAGLTLQGWSDLFGDDLHDATIISISIGVGTFNQGQTAFFDDVRFSNGNFELSYDFEPSVVPLPGAIAFLLTGLAGLGAAKIRRRKAAA